MVLGFLTTRYNQSDAAKKKTNQSLSGSQTGIGAGAHATFDTEQLISHTRTSHVDTIALLQGSDGGVIPVSEVHELLSKIHDVIDNSMSKQMANTAHISAYLHSASRQCCEVWAS